MHKIRVVASAEFGMAVRTKAFIISIVMLPVLMGGSIALQTALLSRVDTAPKAFAVIDHTGSLFEVVSRHAATRNAGLHAQDGSPAGARFEPRTIKTEGSELDVMRLDLSDQVRRQELFAFVEIPAEITAPSASIDFATGPRIQYYSDHPTDGDLRAWIETVVDDEIRSRRFQAAGIDQKLVTQLNRRVNAENLGLLTRGEDGRPKQAEKVDPVRSTAIPAALMFLLFMVVLTSTPQLLNSVLEEKMSRISEVMLGSLTPFELMMGKLLGNCGVALVLGTLYVGGAYAVASRFEYADALTFPLLALFGVFMVIAVVFYGSLYIAIAAAVTEIKDAQSLMMPVMLLSMLPLFTWTAILKSPSSTFSVGVSLFPPATPFLMFLRLSLHPSPPAWQVVLSLVLTIASTIAVVWAAGRIFRVGLLVQGKSATFAQMIRWVAAK